MIATIMIVSSARARVLLLFGAAFLSACVSANDRPAPQPEEMDAREVLDAGVRDAGARSDSPVVPPSDGPPSDGPSSDGPEVVVVVPRSDAAQPEVGGDGPGDKPLSCAADQKSCGTTCIAKTMCCATTDNCVPPTVVQVSPAQGLVEPDVVFSVRFSKPMDRPTTQAAVTFSPPIAATATWDASGLLLELRPMLPLPPVPYEQEPALKLNVAATATDAFGVPLASAASFNYRRLRRYTDQPCALTSTSSVTYSDVTMNRVGNGVLEVGTTGTRSPGRVVDSRAFMQFICSGALAAARDLTGARLILNVKTVGSPVSPDIVINRIATPAAIEPSTYDVPAIGGDFLINANAPASWVLDVSSAVKLPEAAMVVYTFRAKTMTSPSLMGSDQYDLGSFADPVLRMDYVAP